MKFKIFTYLCCIFCIFYSFELDHNYQTITYKKTSQYSYGDSLQQKPPFKSQINKDRILPNLKIPYLSSVSILGQKGFFKNRSIGSGVILRKNKNKTILILTNNHVVKSLDWNNIIIEDINKKQFITRVLKFDSKKDLALLTSIFLELDNGVESIIAQNSPLLGSSLWILGNPKGYSYNITRGILGNIMTSNVNGGKYYRTDAAIFFGNSGGGAYNNKGELIGLVIGMQIYMRGQFPPGLIPGGGVLISRSEIIKFLNKIDLK